MELEFKETDSSVSAIIKGKVPSKSNCYQIVSNGKFSRLAKKKNLKEYEESFYIQLPPSLRSLNIDTWFEFHVDVFYPSNRSDIDNALKILLDCLQKTKTIKNDNKCIKIIANKAVDKDNPRAEFRIVPIK